MKAWKTIVDLTHAVKGYVRAKKMEDNLSDSAPEMLARRIVEDMDRQKAQEEIETREFVKTLDRLSNAVEAMKGQVEVAKKDAEARVKDMVDKTFDRLNPLEMHRQEMLRQQSSNKFANASRGSVLNSDPNQLKVDRFDANPEWKLATRDLDTLKSSLSSLKPSKLADHDILNHHHHQNIENEKMVSDLDSRQSNSTTTTTTTESNSTATTTTPPSPEMLSFSRPTKQQKSRKQTLKEVEAIASALKASTSSSTSSTPDTSNQK